jgi:4-hydroxythreonine-4-phosphate dehydrogenase
MNDRDDIVPVAVSMGDPAGIGLDIAISAWCQRRDQDIPAFFLIADPEQLALRAAKLGADITVKEIHSPSQVTSGKDGGLPVMPVRLPDPTDRPGQPDPANASTILDAISKAVSLAQSGEASGVVTCPIHKASLYEAGFRHPGHTEFLAELCSSNRPVMMLSCPGLRVVPVTIHVSLRRALDLLDGQLIIDNARIVANALVKDFGIASPRLAVAGLNPHAGENGALGDEDATFISDAIETLRTDGIDAFGPLPADTMFGETKRQQYDAAICMYHDQALIPIKTLDFHGAVNVTLGLPIVRTSPDHGTAFDIAGNGSARPDSMIAAIKEADRMARFRRSAV